MSTLKYKASERYDFGWTDPRSVYDPRMPSFEKTGFEDVSTDVLKNLWLVTFQGPSTESLSIEGDMGKVAQELVRRKIVVVKQLKAGFGDARFSYVLKEKDGNS